MSNKIIKQKPVIQEKEVHWKAKCLYMLAGIAVAYGLAFLMLGKNDGVIFMQSCFETGKPENVRLRHSNDSDASGVCSYDNKKSFAGRDPFGNRKGKAFLGGGTVFYASVCFYLLDYALCVFYGWK